MSGQFYDGKVAFADGSLDIVKSHADLLLRALRRTTVHVYSFSLSTRTGPLIDRSIPLLPMLLLCFLCDLQEFQAAYIYVSNFSNRFLALHRGTHLDSAQ